MLALPRLRFLLPPAVRAFTLSAASFAGGPRLPPRMILDEADFTEVFLKGSGPGGQKINKTSSAVQLIHKPTGIVVKSQETRSRSQNRKIARQLLAEKVEHALMGDESRVSKKWQIESAKRASSMKKSARKYRKLDAQKEKVELLKDEWQRYIDSRKKLGLEIPVDAHLGPKLPEGGTKYFRKGSKTQLEWPDEEPKIRRLIRDSNGNKVDFIIDDEKLVMESDIIGPKRERLTINAKAVKASDWMWEMPGIVEVALQHQDDYPKNVVQSGAKDEVALMYRGMSGFDYVREEEKQERLAMLKAATEVAVEADKAKKDMKAPPKVLEKNTSLSEERSLRRSAV